MRSGTAARPCGRCGSQPKSSTLHLYHAICGCRLVRQLLLLSSSSSAAALPLLLGICTAILAGGMWCVSSCCSHFLHLLLLFLCFFAFVPHYMQVHGCINSSCFCCFSSPDSLSIVVLTVVAACLVRACASACAAVMAPMPSSPSSAGDPCLHLGFSSTCV